MQALVLVGGEGTRLRPLTRTAPKPVIPLVDRPFIRYVIDWLARHGVEDVVLSIGFLAHGIREGLGDEIPGGPRLVYVEEPDRRGTAGAIKYAEEHLDDRFLALNGDVLTDLDLTALIRRHEEAGATATLALYPVDDPTAYGLVRRKEDGEISEFLEKPDPAEIDTDEISAGAYVLERSVLDMIPPDREFSIEREVFPRLVGNGLYSQRLEGYWMDIGTPERYLQASWDILERRVETQPGAMVDDRGVFVADDAEVSGDAELAESVFVEGGARVAAGASVGPRAVLGPSCEIGEGASVSGSVLHGSCEVGSDARVEGSILAPNVRVAAGALVEPGSVIGQGAVVDPGATVATGSRIEPADEVVR
jgi:mannose-1-phosphate guanylyltransferase